ncbi:MAG: hypothetical protein R2712_09105 [Vicinamibacterales bacterium]
MHRPDGRGDRREVGDAIFGRALDELDEPGLQSSRTASNPRPPACVMAAAIAPVSSSQMVSRPHTTPSTT